MFKTVSVFSLAGMFAALMMVSGYAEITGSGFRNVKCSGEFTLNLFMDNDGDGFHGKDEPGFNKAELYLSLTDFPDLGKEKFTTDSDGLVRIDLLCKGVFSIEVDRSTIPAAAIFEGVYEDGQLIVDATMENMISVALSNGIEESAPGTRRLDIAFGMATRGLSFR